jgi:hypothetical protein
VNPGLMLFNLGADFEITPRLRNVNNINFLWFDKTSSLEVLTMQNHINRTIGVDLSSGFEYRPILNNNLILVGGLSGLVPGSGFRQAYHAGSAPALLSAFMEIVLAF